MVGVREALGAVQLARLQHAQADVDHDVGGALDRYRDERKAVFRRDSRGGLIRPAGVVCTVVAHQEGGDAQGTGFDFGRELQLDYRGLAPPPAVMVGAGSSTRWPTEPPNCRDRKAVTAPWCWPEALMVCSGSSSERASQLPRR